MQLSFGVYKRKVVFFLVLFLILGGIFYFLSQQFSSASINDLAVSTYGGKYTIDINISADGQVSVDDKNYNRLLIPGQEYDEFRYLAAEREGVFIDQLDIYVHLPQAVGSEEIKQRAYAIHGVGSYDEYLKDSQTLVYSAFDLSPSASFTIVAELPKGMIDFPWWRQILIYFYNLPGWIWLIVSIILPSIALLVLLFMFRQSIADWRIKKPKEVLKAPPSNLSPAEVGVLVEGNVSARSIAAVLLDLARRNYLLVINKGKEFSFGKKKPVDLGSPQESRLRPFERTLLSKIFTEQGISSTTKDIQIRIGRHIFSRKVAEVYLDIYESVTNKGYFLENPSAMHSHYRLAGIILFFIALIGFIFGIFFAPDPKFYLLFWAGMIFTSFIIIRMSPRLPIRTIKGQKELYSWLKFKNFLTDSSPIGYIEGAQEIFEKYLPYAIALRCESEWTKRFIEHPFRQPDWYTSLKPVIILEDFVGDLFPVIGFIAEELAASREPIV